MDLNQQEFTARLESSGKYTPTAEFVRAASALPSERSASEAKTSERRRTSSSDSLEVEEAELLEMLRKVDGGSSPDASPGRVRAPASLSSDGAAGVADARHQARPKMNFNISLGSQGAPSGGGEVHQRIEARETKAGHAEHASKPRRSNFRRASGERSAAARQPRQK